MPTSPTIVFSFSNWKAAIFDVDGTLYDHQKVKRAMLFEMIGTLALRPTRWREIVYVAAFRKFREDLVSMPARTDLAEYQYRYAAKKLGCSSHNLQRAVTEWMFERPLAFIRRFAFPEMVSLGKRLKQRGILVGCFSDYPASRKLSALQFPYDCCLCSTDGGISALKPHPKGLVLTANKMGVGVEECLFIGDRDDKDGECARRAKMAYEIVNDAFGRRELVSKCMTFAGSV